MKVSSATAQKGCKCLCGLVHHFPMLSNKLSRERQ